MNTCRIVDIFILLNVPKGLQKNAQSVSQNWSIYNVGWSILYALAKRLARYQLFHKRYGGLSETMSEPRRPGRHHAGRAGAAGWRCRLKTKIDRAKQKETAYCSSCNLSSDTRFIGFRSTGDLSGQVNDQKLWTILNIFTQRATEGKLLQIESPDNIHGTQRCPVHLKIPTESLLSVNCTGHIRSNPWQTKSASNYVLLRESNESEWFRMV